MPAMHHAYRSPPQSTQYNAVVVFILPHFLQRQPVVLASRWAASWLRL